MKCLSTRVAIRTALAPVLMGVLALTSMPSQAESVSYNFGQTFSGTSPAGGGPWLTATFSTVSPGTVALTIAASGLTGAETIDALYFNLDPALAPGSLSFARNAASTGPTDANTVISLGANQFKADGDGMYDVLIDLPPPPGQQSARFEAGETLIYTISGIPTLSASSFYFLSQPAGGSGPFLAAAHVQQIGGNDSGWVAPTAAVPIPAAAWLLLSGLGLVCGSRRRAAAS